MLGHLHKYLYSICSNEVDIMLYKPWKNSRYYEETNKQIGNMDHELKSSCHINRTKYWNTVPTISIQNLKKKN